MLLVGMDSYCAVVVWVKGDRLVERCASGGGGRGLHRRRSAATLVVVVVVGVVAAGAERLRAEDMGWSHGRLLLVWWR